MSSAFECSLGSATSSLIEMNNQKMISVSQKAVEQQKVLSTTLLENAQLKKTIAATEAENVCLTVEVRNLRAKLESLSSEESLSLQARLDSASEEITRLRNELSKTKKSHGRKTELHTHKEELKRARAEIARLSEKNDEEDDVLTQLQHSLLKRGEQSESEQLRRENQALKMRIAELEASNAKANANALRMRKRMVAFAEEFVRKIADFEAKAGRELANIKDHMSCIASGTDVRRAPKHTCHGTAKEYLEQLARGIQSIEELNSRYAKH